MSDHSRPGWRSGITDREVEARFLILAAQLPSEGDLWSAPELAPPLLAALERCSAGSLVTAPAPALAAAVIDGCLALNHLDTASRNLRYKAIERHAGVLHPYIRVDRYANPIPAAALGLPDIGGCTVSGVIYPGPAGPDGWIAARVCGSIGELAVAGRSPDDPWSDIAIAHAAALRAATRDA